MDNVTVTIYPSGWLTLLGIILLILFIGYVIGFYNGWLAGGKSNEQMFDFENKTQQP